MTFNETERIRWIAPGPSLTLEDWLLLGRAIPSLESSLRNFLESNRTEIMNRDAFHLDRKCILFDRAIFALGWLETPRDTGKFLAGLANEKMVGLRFFDSALIQAF